MPLLAGVVTRFDADEPKSARRPSAESETPELAEFACWPASFCEARLNVCVRRSYRNASNVPFASPATNLSSIEWKATQRPSAEIDGARLSVPENVVVVKDAKTVAPVARSRR